MEPATPASFTQILPSSRQAEIYGNQIVLAYTNGRFRLIYTRDRWDVRDELSGYISALEAIKLYVALTLSKPTPNKQWGHRVRTKDGAYRLLAPKVDGDRIQLFKDGPPKTESFQLFLTSASDHAFALASVKNAWNDYLVP